MFPDCSLDFGVFGEFVPVAQVARSKDMLHTCSNICQAEKI